MKRTLTQKWTRMSQVVAFACTVMVATAASVVTPTTPLGLSVMPFGNSGSDEGSAIFNQNAFKDITGIINSGDYSSVVQLDPAQLILQSDANVRVYLVGENVAKNSLGFGTADQPINPDTAKLIFADVTVDNKKVGDPYPNQPPDGKNGEKLRTTDSPLVAGDFVDLGTIASGTKLDFFVIANGALGGSTTYDNISNPDRFKAFYVDGHGRVDSPYVVITYSSTGSGLPDMAFALDMSGAGLGPLVGTPEPPFYLCLSGFFMIAWWAKRRTKPQKTAA